MKPKWMWQFQWHWMSGLVILCIINGFLPQGIFELIVKLYLLFMEVIPPILNMVLNIGIPDLAWLAQSQRHPDAPPCVVAATTMRFPSFARATPTAVLHSDETPDDRDGVEVEDDGYRVADRARD